MAGTSSTGLRRRRTELLGQLLGGVRLTAVVTRYRDDAGECAPYRIVFESIGEFRGLGLLRKGSLCDLPAMGPLTLRHGARHTNPRAVQLLGVLDGQVDLVGRAADGEADRLAVSTPSRSWIGVFGNRRCKALPLVVTRSMPALYRTSGKFPGDTSRPPRPVHPGRRWLPPFEDSQPIHR